MIAFAANSVLTRQALAHDQIDAASFSTIRIVSGAFVLALIASWRGVGLRAHADWRMALALFGYVACFSFAYRWLDAGAGALILFGAVQFTMLTVGFARGERFTAIAWVGALLATGGLIYLLAPGARAPEPLGGALMVAAGVAWGVYSLLGRGAGSALGATTASFLLALGPVALLSLVFLSDARATAQGVALAVASGAVASGCGYVVWYAALPRLAATHAATVQLSAPILAALGGAAVLAEPITSQLLIASAAVLGGLALVLTQPPLQRPLSKT